MSWNPCQKRPQGPTCSRCGRQHPPPPPPAAPPTDEGARAVFLLHEDARRALWCASWRTRT